jgi:hypothetical protein
MVERDDVKWQWWALADETHLVGVSKSSGGLLGGPGKKMATFCAFATRDWDRAPDLDVTPRIRMETEGGNAGVPMCWRCIILHWVTREADQANELIERLETLGTAEHGHDLLWRVQAEVEADMGSVVIQAYEQGDVPGQVRRTAALASALEDDRFIRWVLD